MEWWLGSYWCAEDFEDFGGTKGKFRKSVKMMAGKVKVLVEGTLGMEEPSVKVWDCLGWLVVVNFLVLLDSEGGV